MSDAVLIALIAALGSTAAALISAVTLVWTRNTHQLINSRMDELLSQARSLARAEGVAQGEQAQRDRSSPPEVSP